MKENINFKCTPGWKNLWDNFLIHYRIMSQISIFGVWSPAKTHFLAILFCSVGFVKILLFSPKSNSKSLTSCLLLVVPYYALAVDGTVAIVEGPHSCFTFIQCPYDFVPVIVS